MDKLMQASHLILYAPILQYQLHTSIRIFFIAVVYTDRLSAENLHLLTFKETLKNVQEFLL